MGNENVVFENLRRRSSIVGEQGEKVQAKAKPFVSSNASGVLREVSSLDEVRSLAGQLGRKIAALVANNK